MANGYQALGDALGGGTAPLRQNAFMQGQLAQANVGHLSAQTQEALSQAKVNQLKATEAEDMQKRTSSLAEDLVKGGLDPQQAQLYATVLNVKGGNFEQVAQGQGYRQTQGFRDTLGNPNADPAARLAASSAIEGKPVSPFVSVPQESVNAFDPNVANPTADPTVHDTPLADAIIGQHNATANLSTAQATHPELFHPKSGDGGPKAPTNYQWVDPADTSKGVKPIIGSKADPNAPVVPGSREAIFHDRMVNSANQVVGDLKNVVELPIGASTGILGVGGSPGKSIFDSAKSTLLNTVASQDVQDYNSILPGLDRNLASIEANGLVPSGTFSDSFSKLALREGDTELTKLAKLAQVRQIVENGMTPSLSSTRITADQKNFIKTMLDDLKKAVPFTRNDIIALRREQEKNPSATLNDLIKRNNPGGKANGAAPPTFGTEAEAEAAGLAPGTKVVIGGVSGTWH